MRTEDEAYESLANSGKKVDNVEEPIQPIAESIKQSDVMEHLEKVRVDKD